MRLSRNSNNAIIKWSITICCLLIATPLVFAQNLKNFEFLTDHTDYKSSFYKYFDEKSYSSYEDFFAFSFATSPQFLKLFSSINQQSRNTVDTSAAEAQINQLLHQSQEKYFQQSKLKVGVPLPYVRFKRFKSMTSLNLQNKKDTLLEINKETSPTVSTVLQQRKDYSINTIWKYAGKSPIYSLNLTHSILNDIAATRDSSYLVARGELFTFEDASQSGKLTALTVGSKFTLANYDFYGSVEDIPIVSQQNALTFKRKTAYLLSISQKLLLYNKIHFTPILRTHYRQRVSIIENITAELHFSPLESTSRLSVNLNPNFSGFSLETSLWKFLLAYQLDLFYGSKYSGLPLQHQLNISIPFEN